MFFNSNIFLNRRFYFDQGQVITDLIASSINKEGEIDCFFLFSEGDYDKDSSRITLFILFSLYHKIFDVDCKKNSQQT